MAIASISRMDSRVTPPATPNTSIDSKDFTTTDLAPKTCLSKNCIHKHKDESQMSHGDRKKKADSDTDSSDSESSSESSDSSSDSSSESEEDAKRSKSSKPKSDRKGGRSRHGRRRGGKRGKAKKTKEAKPDESTEKQESSSAKTEDSESLESLFKSKGVNMELLRRAFTEKDESTTQVVADSESSDDSDEDSSAKKKKRRKETKTKSKKKCKKASKVEFKRLDEIWDDDLYDYKLKETSEESKDDEYDQYIFTVRRKFDDEGHHQMTVVCIKSEFLKQSLQKVMDGVENISLVEETPQLDPNMLFLFLEEFRALSVELKKQSKHAEKKKDKKAAATELDHLQILIKYLDKDYDATKKRLNPLLQNGRISFDLLWALFKPNTLAYTAFYNDKDQPRAFKILSGEVTRSFAKGVCYEIEGQYLDFDGKSFGTAKCYGDISSFQGTRKITSLSCYPITYHQDTTKLKTRLLERGKKFLTLAGMNYGLYNGMAYLKKNEKILRANVNGRIMIDPGTFRRINPNYPLNNVLPREVENIDEDDDCCCQKLEAKKKQRAERKEKLFRLITADKEDSKVVEVDPSEQEELEKHVDSAEKETDLQNTFTEEELLIASAVLPGFSFTEKAWLEFAVSEVKDVVWNEGAFESLVLPEKHKSIVKALVSAHSLHASKGIDDVIAGKGKGLVAVLHGRPGLGKTLTCEAVSDLLKRPLYTVSAGDLGTHASQLEPELQNILDIAHTWNAVLLLDEADVFLEERSIHDIHRNALVSIFLRLLEYFQGILFLTTNRVQTFDEAFVSRIHLSLRYGDLTSKAKKSVWQTFIEKVRATEGMEVEEITDADYFDLVKQDMNGRQIKNLVKTAQAVALHDGVPMGMKHIRQVIDVARSFEMDLKGGMGFEDAMRSYT